MEVLRWEDIDMTMNNDTTVMEKMYRHHAGGRTLKRIQYFRRMAALMVIGLLLIVIAVIMGGCEKKELCYLPHPHDKKICHTELTLTFNTGWDGDPIYSTTYAAGSGDVQGQESGFNSRYVLEFWALNDANELDTLIEHREVSDGKMLNGQNTYAVSVDLPAARIAVMCWAEPIVPGAASNPHFDTRDLRQVRLADYGLAPDKDAFTAGAVWDYTPYQFERDGIALTAKMNLSRPFGKYRLISNDIREYREQKGAHAPLPVKAEIGYQLWLPSTYDVFSQLAVNPTSGVKYNYTPSVLKKDEEMIMAEDLIFIGTADGSDNYYNFVVRSYAPGGSLIRQSGNVEARVHRNKLTLIYGAMLTDRKTNVPGIDDGFDEEIVIVVPD